MKNNPQSKHKLDLPGFTLSTNYEELWRLIYTGHRVPGWLVYTDEYEKPIWDIVEIKISVFSDKKYMIGIRGTGYEGWDNNIESFVAVCEKYSLHFIMPNDI